jgi:hypothetical protein
MAKRIEILENNTNKVAIFKRTTKMIVSQMVMTQNKGTNT